MYNPCRDYPFLYGEVIGMCANCCKDVSISCWSQLISRYKYLSVKDNG